jgi:hypothetical protein
MLWRGACLYGAVAGLNLLAADAPVSGIDLPMSQIGNRLNQLRRPPRPHWSLLVLFLLLNAALFGAVGIVYLLVRVFESLPKQ